MTTKGYLKWIVENKHSEFLDYFIKFIMSDLPLDFVGMLELGKYHEPPSKRQGKWFNQIDLAGSLLTFPDWA